MSVSTAQQTANENNAQKSTGPRTVEGKARSARNSTSLGIYAKSPVLPGEDPQKWRDFRDAMLSRLDPRDQLELQFAEQVVFSSWNLQRLRSVEVRFIELRIEQDLQSRQNVRDKQLAMLQQAWATQQSQVVYQNNSRNRARVEEAHLHLEKLEKKFKAEPLVRLSGEEMLAKLMADADPALERFHRHQQRLESSIHRSMNKLEKLQQNSISEPDEFARKQMSKNEPKTASEASESGSPHDPDRIEDLAACNTGVSAVLLALETEPISPPTASHSD